MRLTLSKPQKILLIAVEIVFVIGFCLYYWIYGTYRMFRDMFYPSYRPPVSIEWQDFNYKGISLDFPQDWYIMTLPQGNHGDKEMIARMDPFPAGYPVFHVMKSSFNASSLEEVAAWGERRIQVKEKDYQDQPIEEITLNGYPALMKSYSFVIKSEISFLESLQMYCREAYLLNGTEGYIVKMCVNEASYSPETREVLDQIFESVSFD